MFVDVAVVNQDEQLLVVIVVYYLLTNVTVILAMTYLT
jgi:hypothetical protein